MRVHASFIATAAIASSSVAIATVSQNYSTNLVDMSKFDLSKILTFIDSTKLLVEKVIDAGLDTLFSTKDSSETSLSPDQSSAEEPEPSTGFIDSSNQTVEANIHIGAGVYLKVDKEEESDDDCEEEEEEKKKKFWFWPFSLDQTPKNQSLSKPHGETKTLLLKPSSQISIYCNDTVRCNSTDPNKVFWTEEDTAKILKPRFVLLLLCVLGWLL